MKNKNTTINSMLFLIVIITILSMLPLDVNAKVSSLKITVLSDTQILLEWDDILGTEDYRIERKTDSGDFERRSMLGRHDNSFYDYGLYPGHVYTYRVVALDHDDNLITYTDEITIDTNLVINPIDLQVNPLSSDSVEINWSYGSVKSCETVIERRESGSSKWRVVSYVPAGKSRYVDKGLEMDTRYYYRIAAVSGSNIYSQYYPKSGGYSARTLLSGPEKLEGYVTGALGVYLTWDDVNVKTGYVIERSEEDDAFIVVGTTGRNKNSWIDTDVTEGKNYTYRVKAENSGNMSHYSNEITITCIYVASPVLVTAEALNSSEVEINWSDPPTLEGDFELWRKVGIEGEWTLYTVLPRNVRKYMDRELTAGQRHYYKLRMYIPYKHAYSTFTKEVSAVPAYYWSPDNLTATFVSEKVLRLSWKGSTQNVDSYIVERRTPEEEWINLAFLNGDTQYFVDRSIGKERVYYYRVAARNSGLGTVSYSPILKVAKEVPQSPTNLSVTPLSSGMIKLTWDNNSDVEEGFIIQRKVGNTSFRTIDRVNAGTTSYINEGLTPEINYGYRVCAYNNAGISGYSSVRYGRTKKAASFMDLQGHSVEQTAIELYSAGILQSEEQRLRLYDDITRGEFVSLVSSTLNLENSKAVGAFDDVIYGDKFYDEIMAAARAGIILGGEKSSFYPDYMLRREDMAVIIYRALDYINCFSNDIDFIDIDKYSDSEQVSDYARNIIAILIAEDIYDVQDDLIRPQDGVTRAEAIKVIYKIFVRCNL
jgi:fibronectin type 3 domain-containing protein